ncbi:Efflux pump periplasmic linker BepF [Pseudovibrio axinellae]|uniref:Efflux pump periplasmic linker BepF n=1 Tax=Pseudovibrio axinellae TaxID=989403 RepID=A0A165YUG5_9HYPH|nr:efflux RND transporter periplasmic adaptor subunit [Pseudovibrio axinellae]KZL19246.1 Efflux pump periplasmic linker BepF [Pseudovibrio axinellae]SEQ44371.1 membrane fusion protein, multidrug efflux system [Pseudovibrio axinellae]
MKNKKRTSSSRNGQLSFSARNFSLLPLLVCLSVVFVPGAVTAQETPPPPGVIVELVRMQSIEEERVFAGRTEAISQIALIARVGGFLEPLEFKEGQNVKRGDLLYVIQQEPYEFAVAQSQANLESAQANVDLAQLDFNRKQQLVSRDTISVSELDVARANLKEANATLALRQADLKLSELDLSYTEIHAPLDGQIGTSAFKQGAYVTANSGTLATITSLDPIRVAFPVPQSIILQAQRLDNIGTDNTLIRLQLSDGKFYMHNGKLDFLEAEANPGTDTVTAYATFENPEHMLFDSQLVDVVVSAKDAKPVMVISQSALLLDQDGPYVLKVDKEDVVKQQRISVVDQIQGLVIVGSGLKEGEQVITSGIQKVRPGIKVNAQLAGQ